MSRTPDSPDGWLIPPPWLREIDPQEIEKMRERFLEAVEHGRGPIILPLENGSRWRLRRRWHRLRWRWIWRPNGR